jgi:hypothetical protein
MSRLVTVQFPDREFETANLLARLTRNGTEVENTTSASCDGVVYRSLIIPNDDYPNASAFLDYLKYATAGYSLENEPILSRADTIYTWLDKNIPPNVRMNFFLGVPGEDSQVYLAVSVADDDLETTMVILDQEYPQSFYQNFEGKSIWGQDRIFTFYSVIMGRGIGLKQIMNALGPYKIRFRSVALGSCGFVNGSDDESVAFRQLTLILDQDQDASNVENGLMNVRQSAAQAGQRFDWARKQMLIVKELGDKKSRTTELSLVSALLGGTRRPPGTDQLLQHPINIHGLHVFPSDIQNQQFYFSLGTRLDG